MPTRKTTQGFLNDIKLKGVRNDDYDYSKVDYTGASKKVVIIDKRYNSEHLIIASEVLALKGNKKEALKHYKQAVLLAEKQNDSQLEAYKNNLSTFN